IFKGRFRALVFSVEYGPGLRLPIGQRRSATAPFDIAPAMDPPDDPVAEKAPGLRARIARIPTPGEQKRTGLHEELRRRDRALHLQPRAVFAARPARSQQLLGNDAG